MLKAKQEGIASTPSPHSLCRVGMAVSAVQSTDLVPKDEGSSQLLKAQGHVNHYPVTVLFHCGSIEDVVLTKLLS